MNNKTLTEKESLEIITTMIERTKERYMLGDGNILLLWGYLSVGIAALVWTLLALTHNPAVNWLWFLIWIIGGIATPIMARRQSRRKGMKSATDKIISRLWSVVGFSAIACTFCCLGFLLFGGVDSWSMMFAFALIIVPMIEIAQGIILDERSFVWGGSVGLLAGIITLACIAGHVELAARWMMPLFIAGFAAMMIIPGHVLNYKARRQR
ncbi:MAG: hypothetical protein J6L73_00095 [Muribaculaceae bacterium]|nr:hypothetical protein [Muribaculaceae bacterium]